jgi:hypothetical protein
MIGLTVRQLSELANSNENDIVGEIEQVLATSAGGSLTVKAARDTFTKMLARVREGDMQLIGRKTEDMAVLISLKDLAALISSSAKTLSFGSALDEVGFKPLGKRIKIAPRSERPSLRRTRGGKTMPAASHGM